VRQVHAVAEALARRRMERPDAVWMLDDDLVLERVIDAGGQLRTMRDVPHLAELARIRAERPDVSVGIGDYSGAPPIRPEAMLHGSTVDLAAHLERAAASDPDAPYRPARQAAALPDFYYDHTEAGSTHLALAFPWPLSTAAGTEASELRAHLEALQGPGGGAATTRTLLDANEPTIEVDDEALETPLRGGNAVFFDLDAFLFHPYPSVEVQGVRTRRADMIGATCLAADGATPIHRLAFSLHHRRLPARPSAEALLASVRGEFHGVMLARRIMRRLDTDELAAKARDRVERIVENAASTFERVESIERELTAGTNWWARDPEVRERVADVLSALRAILRDAFGVETRAPAERLFARLADRLALPHSLETIEAYAASLEDELRAQRRAVRRFFEEQP
jgi:hypothetical protein